MRAMAMMVTLAWAALASTAACAPGRAAESVDPGAPALGSRISVSVENQRPMAMRIFATRANMKFLVGEVGPRETGRFMLPAMLLAGTGDLRLLADPWSSTLHQQSEPIVLDGGREVEWRLRAGGGERIRVR